MLATCLSARIRNVRTGCWSSVTLLAKLDKIVSRSLRMEYGEGPQPLKCHTPQRGVERKWG